MSHLVNPSDRSAAMARLHDIVPGTYNTRRPVAYIAGPYAAGDVSITRNVIRAVAVGQLFAAREYSPVVPHAFGSMGLYGIPDESEAGVRDRAVSCGASLATWTGALDGTLAIILKADGTMSDGTAVERRAFQVGGGISVLAYTWAGWRAAFNNCGMLDVYEAAT